jgi:hypothetical protein
VSDEFTVPLCRGHHRELRRSGREAEWWSKAGIDPTVQARALWLQTHPLPRISNQTETKDAFVANSATSREHSTNDKTNPMTAAGPR